jgi:hypothetical protein
MSSANLEVVFEGPAVKAGMIDARLLGDSLMGYSEVFTRSNAIVNGEVSEAAVLVQSDFKPGSFGASLQFVQNIVEHATQLITAHQFLNATELAVAIGFIWKNREAVKESLLDLYKWLRGKKPDNVVQVGNNVEITFGQNKKTVTNVVFNLYSDAAIRAGLGRLTSPLRQSAIDRITVKQDGTDQATIEKSEAEYFEPEPMQLESDSAPMEGERDAILIVAKLSFTEGSTWTFFERGATVVARIEDEAFWQQVHQHNVTFGEGDKLRVRLSWKIERKKKLTQKNTIVKVYELLERPKQMRLDGKKDDDIITSQRPGRKIRNDD